MQIIEIAIIPDPECFRHSGKIPLSTRPPFGGDQPAVWSAHTLGEAPLPVTKVYRDSLLGGAPHPTYTFRYKRNFGALNKSHVLRLPNIIDPFLDNN